jgi:hypothetical protein
VGGTRGRASRTAGASERFPHYVVRFEPVSSLEDIPLPKELPWLLASKSWDEKRVAQQAANPDGTSKAEEE